METNQLWYLPWFISDQFCLKISCLYYDVQMIMFIIRKVYVNPSFLVSKPDQTQTILYKQQLALDVILKI